MSFISEHIIEILLMRIVSSPGEFFVKKLGLRKNVRAMTAFCKCISAILLIRSVQRLRVSENSMVPMPAPTSNPRIGNSSFASPVGITISKIILLAIGVNIPNKVSIKAAANRSTMFDTGIDFMANRSKSLLLRGLLGNGLQNVMA